MKETVKVMIDNSSKFSMTDIYEYLSGFTTKLNGRITVTEIKGNYYNNLIIKDK